VFVLCGVVRVVRDDGVRECGFPVCGGSDVCGSSVYGDVKIVQSVSLSSSAVKCSFVCKAVPLQACSGPEGSRNLRLPDYMTTAQDGGKVVSLTHRAPLPQEMLLVPISVRG
jgi:hypothetical protein